MSPEYLVHSLQYATELYGSNTFPQNTNTETIVNEHPVTIYPGRSSPTKLRSNSNSASPRNPQCGSGGPASPHFASLVGTEPNDNTMTDTHFESFVGRNSPSGVQQHEQKLSKLFASAMRTEELSASSNAMAAHGELITLKSVFSNAHRLNNNTAESSMAADSAASANRRTYVGLKDDETDNGGAYATAAGPVEPENGEEFSDDSLEDEPAAMDAHSLHSLLLSSSVASLGGGAIGAKAVHHQQQAYPMRQLADVHTVQNGGSYRSGPTETDGNDGNAEDNGPWVLREDIAQRVDFSGRKSNLVSVHCGRCSLFVRSEWVV